MALNSGYFGSFRQVRFFWIWSFFVTAFSFATKSFATNEKQRKSRSGSASITLPMTSQQAIQPSSSSSSSSSPLLIKSDLSISNSNDAAILPSTSIGKIKTSIYFSDSFISRFILNQYRLFANNSNRMQLVLDLDETLISSSSKHSSKHDMSVQVYISGTPSTFYVRKRPHVDHFLETVSQWFEVIVFTASISPYANAVIDKLDPKRLISRRYYRQSCMNKGGSYVKDLRVVCKDLSKVIIIDNSPIAYSCNKENAIPIDDYIGNNSQDRSLLNLLPYLEQVKDSNLDVRQSLKLFQKVSSSKKSRIGS